MGLAKKVLVVMLFIVISALTIVYEPPSVKADSTIYIKADGSVQPSTAPISTTDKITYKLTNNITEPIVIERSNIIVNGQGFTVKGSGSGAGFSLSSISNVTIKNITIKSFSQGISVSLSSHIKITNATISGNSYGIYIQSSESNTLISNTITSNSLYGISLAYSSNNTVDANVMANNKYNLDISWSALTHLLNNITASNTINGKPVYYWINRHDETVPSNAGYVALINCTRITMQNLNLIKNGHGILIINSTNVTITQNTVADNYYGIFVSSSSYINISKTIVSNTKEHGIYLNSSSNNNISENTLTSSGEGIYIQSSSLTTINNNNITSSNYYGIFVSSSSYINISKTIVSNTKEHGIYLNSSSNNNISKNTLTSNVISAIFLMASSNNNTIEGNKITSCGQGIFLQSSHLNMIANNNITSNGSYGIGLSSSNENRISGNNLTLNNYGISLAYSSNNTLETNVMANNKYNFDVWGLTFTHFINNITASNLINGKPVYYWINRHDETVPSNAGYVALINCTRTTVQDLNLSQNGQGLLMAYTTNSTVFHNNVTNNYYGIRMRDSSNNLIYYNSFINNTYQVSAYNSTNQWDNGYPIGGNYWSNYQGVDLYRGVNQNESGSDGIGDTPHILGTNMQDNYPLIKPYGGTSDIGIRSISASKTIVGYGQELNITITILNYGLNTETFNLTVYLNMTQFHNITGIILTGRNSTLLNFSWNAIGFSKGNYTLWASVSILQNELDIRDNTLLDGWIFILSQEHDVAIRSIISRPIVGAGYTTPVDVKAMNVGAYAETFNVTFWVNSTPIAYQTIHLESGASAIVSFTWNTTGFLKGDYILTAIAETVLYEIDFTDNQLDCLIKVTKVGDLGGGIPPQFFQCDSKVDGKDLSLFLLCFKGAAPPEAMYLGDLGGGLPPKFYLCDGKIDGRDLSLFLQCFKGAGPN